MAVFTINAGYRFDSRNFGSTAQEGLSSPFTWPVERTLFYEPTPANLSAFSSQLVYRQGPGPLPTIDFGLLFGKGPFTAAQPAGAPVSYIQTAAPAEALPSPLPTQARTLYARSETSALSLFEVAQGTAPIGTITGGRLDWYLWIDAQAVQFVPPLYEYRISANFAGIDSRTESKGLFWTQITSGDDILRFAEGDDYFVDNGGALDAELGAGNDTLRAFALTGDASAPDTIDGGPGNDRIEFQNGGHRILGGTGDDLILNMGNNAASSSLGMHVDGGAGNDRIEGNIGDDTLIGGDGDDFVDGKQGNDQVDLGPGDDVILFNDAQASTIDGRPGLDMIRAWDMAMVGQIDLKAPDDQYRGAAVVRNVEGIDFSRIAPGVSYSGTEAANKFLGTGGGDVLKGLGGADILIGGGGNDALLGEGEIILTANAKAVTRLYLATLGRKPDAGGLQDWTAALDRGATLEQIVSGFTNSPEFKQRYGNLDDAGFVTLLYRNVFGRDPDAQGFQTWTTALKSGGIYTRDFMVMEFSGSTEFRMATDPDVHAGQIFRLYQATLGRTPDSLGYSNWLDDMSGMLRLPGAAHGFVDSPEFQQRFGAPDDAGFVTLLYRNVLARDPDAQGLQDWSSRLAAGQSRVDVTLGFAESEEFRTTTQQPFYAYARTATPDRNNTLIGGSGDDTLAGGEGSDRFVFVKNRASSFEHDVVYGLDPWDVIEMVGFGFTTREDVFASMFNDDLVTFGHAITFVGESPFTISGALRQIQPENWIFS